LRDRISWRPLGEPPSRREVVAAVGDEADRRTSASLAAGRLGPGDCWFKMARMASTPARAGGVGELPEPDDAPSGNGEHMGERRANRCAGGLGGGPVGADRYDRVTGVDELIHLGLPRRPLTSLHVCIVGHRYRHARGIARHDCPSWTVNSMKW